MHLLVIERTAARIGLNSIDGFQDIFRSLQVALSGPDRVLKIENPQWFQSSCIMQIHDAIAAVTTFALDLQLGNVIQSRLGVASFFFSRSDYPGLS